MSEQPQTGGIRMLAFGVLEYVPVPFPGGRTASEVGAEIERSAEVEVLVRAEIKALGWLIMKAVNKWGNNKTDKFILMGKVGGSDAVRVRPKIGEGTLRECCIAAVHFLDRPGDHPATWGRADIYPE